MKKPVLELKNISLKFHGMSKNSLSNVNYNVYKSDFIMLVGSNGSGKTSLLKLIDRRYQPTSGEIVLQNKKLADFNEREFSQSIVTLTQNCHETLFPSLTVLENFLLVKQKIQRHLLSLRTNQEKIFLMDYLAQFNRHLPEKLHAVVDKLSGGEKQALALALCIFHPPQILLLDEHTSALDPLAAQQLMELTRRMIQKFNITCIMTTHDLALAHQYGNRVLALKQGKVHQEINDKNKQSLTETMLLAACY